MVLKTTPGTAVRDNVAELERMLRLERERHRRIEDELRDRLNRTLREQREYADGIERHRHADPEKALCLVAAEPGWFDVRFTADPAAVNTLPTTGSGVFESAEPEWVSSDPEAGWDFNLFGVWVRDGVAYWGRDSGCSCPTPWEGLSTYDQLTSGSIDQCIAAFDEYARGYRYGEDDIHPDHKRDRARLFLWLDEQGVS